MKVPGFMPGIAGMFGTGAVRAMAAIVDRHTPRVKPGSLCATQIWNRR
jgi:hypothetical protein